MTPFVRSPLLALAVLLTLGASVSIAAAVRPSGADERIDRVLRDLGSTDLSTRDRAQAELARVLTREEQAGALASAIDHADPEARRRVMISIGADDRLLGLAVRLATNGDPDVAAVGRASIESQLLRWSVTTFDEPTTAVFDPGRQSVPLPGSWRDRAAFRISVDPNAGGGVGAFDRLDRLGLGPAPLVIDPHLAERMVRRPTPAALARRVDGSWSEVLEALCVIHNAAYQVQGYRYPGEQRASDIEVDDDDIARIRPWIHLVPRRTTERASVGSDLRRRAGSHIVDWCLIAQREGNLIRQSAAARALAGIDWPAPILWFETRWLATGDVVALEGLMAAAARGRVAPALQQRASVRSVLRFVDKEAREVERLERAFSDALAPASIEGARRALRAAIIEVDERARRFAEGLAGLAPIASGAGPNAPGAPLLPVLLDGFEGATPNGRWVRLVAMEGLGLTSPRVVAICARVLNGELEARSRRQALRALLVALPLRRVVSDVGIQLDDPLALFRELPSGDVAGLGLELGLAGVGVAGSDPAWVRELLRDRAAVTELIVWGALLAEGRQGTRAPSWLVEAVTAALRLEADRNPSVGAGPFSRATAFARGDLARSLWSLVEWVAPALDARRRIDLERAALRAGFASSATRRSALDRSRVALEKDRDDPLAVENAWRDLAALAGDDLLGEAALAALEASLVESIQKRSRGPAGSNHAFVQATEAAVAALERARRDDLSEQFTGTLRRIATRSDHSLADRFLRIDWPPRRPLPPRDLERLAPPLPPR